MTTSRISGLPIKIWIFLLFCSQISCEKSPTLTPTEELPYWGTCSATSNGVAWSGMPFAQFSLINPQVIGIQVDSFNASGILKNTLTVSNIPYKKGIYKIVDIFGQIKENEAGMLLSFSISDEPKGRYLPLTGDTTSYIEISEIIEDSREVKGQFFATLLVVKKPYSYSPDTIRLKNGKFHTKLIPQ